MTIEETREALCGWIDNPLRNKWVKAKTMAAADAYALAAARRVLDYDPDAHSRTGAVPPDCCSYHRLESEIEELGR